MRGAARPVFGVDRQEPALSRENTQRPQVTDTEIRKPSNEPRLLGRLSETT